MTFISQTRPTVLVAGAGPAGFLAAGKASELGAKVVILEKMKRCGRKLNITGKGRCNITNSAPVDEFLPHFGENGIFLKQAFSEFFSQDILNILHSQGLRTKQERGGRIFPESDRAPDVTKALEKWLERKGVKRLTSHPVEQILVKEGRLIGLESRGKLIECDAAVIALGGASYPGTGSTGDGYELAKAIGHTIIPIRPALVPLETIPCLGELDGLTLKNIRIHVEVENHAPMNAFGDMAFTTTGVSGPIILASSGSIVDCLISGKKVQLKIDLKPGLNSSKLSNRLTRDFQNRAHEPVKSLLRGLIPSELVPICLRSLNWNPNRMASSFTTDQIQTLKNWLKGFQLEIKGFRPFSEAIITAGGIPLNEVHSHSMESKIIKNLFFAGEILDLQATTGGYNLQAAFSTGWLAGKSAVSSFI